MLSQFEFLDFEATLDELHSSLAADGDVHCDFFVPLDAEASDGVARLGLNGLLVGEVRQHLGGLGQLIARLSRAEVENKFFDVDLSHLIVELFLLLL